MASNRFFTDTQLRALERRPSDAFIEEMERGNYEKAKLWAENIFILYRYTFDLRVRWDRQFMDCIYKNLGPDGVYDVMRFSNFRVDDLAKLRITPADEEECRGYIAAHNVAACKRWMDVQYHHYRYAHNLRIEWETILMSFIYKNISPEAFIQVYRDDVLDPAFRGRITDIANSGFDMWTRVIRCAWGLHSHGMPLTITEDDEKVTLWMDYCSSGSFVLDKGCYGAPLDCVMCQSKCPEAWSLPNVPIYCMHGAIQERCSIDMVGFPTVVKTPWDECDESGYQMAGHCCHHQIYKDPKDIPDRVYQMLGKERPSTYYFPGYEGFDYKPEPNVKPGLGSKELYVDYVPAPYTKPNFEEARKLYI